MTGNNRNTLSKEERLSSKKLIDELFDAKQSIVEKPISLYWTKSNFKTNIPVQFGVGVPKKNFKRAVDRNKIKRQIKEAYRVNKHDLHQFLEEKGIQCALMVIFIANESIPFKEIENKIVFTLNRLIEELEKNS